MMYGLEAVNLMEFIIPTMRIVMAHQISKEESLEKRMEELLKLHKEKLHAYWVNTTLAPPKQEMGRLSFLTQISQCVHTSANIQYQI